MRWISEKTSRGCKGSAVLGAACALATIGLPAYAQTRPTSGVATMPGLHAAEKWPQLLSDLSSSSFATREAAQRRLDQLSPGEMEEVEAQAARAADPEVKARLLERARDMRIWRAVHPRPLTVNVKDATLEELAAAINRDAGSPIFMPRPRPGISPLFSLDTGPVPFPELVLQLQKKCQLNVELSRNPLGLAPAANTPPLQFQPQDSFLLRATISLTPLRPGAVAEKERPLHIGVSVVPDPRILLVRYSPRFLVHKAVDSQGNDLARDTPAANEPMSDALFGLGPFISAELPLPDRRATSLASTAGVVRLEVAESVERITVKDVENHLGDHIPIAGGEVVISNFDRTNLVRFQAGWSTPVPLARQDSSQTPSTMFSIRDSAGEWCGSYSIRASGGVGIYRGNVSPGPISVEVMVPTHTVQIDLPVAFKGIALPAQR